ASLVKSGKFRADLYYRLKIVSLKIPPLKDRHEDTELLIEHFMNNFNARYHKNISRVSKDVFEFLMSYEFPGNIRELQNIIDYAFIFCKGNEIGAEHLSPEYAQIIERKEAQAVAFRQNAMAARGGRPAAGTNDVSGGEQAASKSGHAEKRKEEDKTVARKQTIDYHATVANEGATDAPLRTTDSLVGATVALVGDAEKLQKQSIMDALLKFGGNKVAAAKYLNIDRSTLWRRMKKFGLM
ncbi:MAG TPA: helix-turn-helix domain-containing protein, partial [Candidatus Wallbacteria bacterium]|nr:helix-turn-helix domain-containing protein [Candidatus Wallbacteria bacterium]